MTLKMSLLQGELAKIVKREESVPSGRNCLVHTPASHEPKHNGCAVPSIVVEELLCIKRSLSVHLFSRLIGGCKAHTTSHRCVQVESFEEGKLISHYVDDPQNSHNVALADIGLSSYLQMLLRDNFIHAGAPKAPSLVPRPLHLYTCHPFPCIHVSPAASCVASSRQLSLDLRTRTVA